MEISQADLWKAGDIAGRGKCGLSLFCHIKWCLLSYLVVVVATVVHLLVRCMSWQRLLTYLRQCNHKYIVISIIWWILVEGGRD